MSQAEHPAVTINGKVPVIGGKPPSVYISNGLNEYLRCDGAWRNPSGKQNRDFFWDSREAAEAFIALHRDQPAPAPPAEPDHYAVVTEAANEIMRFVMNNLKHGYGMFDGCYPFRQILLKHWHPASNLTALQAENDRLKAFLISHEDLWPGMSGSPVDVAIGLLMVFGGYRQRLAAEVAAREAAEAKMAELRALLDRMQ